MKTDFILFKAQWCGLCSLSILMALCQRAGGIPFNVIFIITDLLSYYLLILTNISQILLELGSI